MTNNSILLATNALAGYALASDKAFATLPVTGYIVGAAMTTMPASLLMRRLGRRTGFMLGLGPSIRAGGRADVLVCRVYS